MKSVVFPPVDPKPEEFVITRRSFGRTFLLRFAWGESWRLRSPDADTYLKMLGDPNPGLTLDLAWSFRAVHYTVDSHVALAIPPGIVDEVLGSVARSRVIVGA